MVDEPENLALRMLRQVDAKLDTIMERLHDLTARTASLEDQFAVMKSDLALMRGDLARIEHRMDGLDSASNESSVGLI